MLRSFNYAAVAALKSDALRKEDAAKMRPWAHFWSYWVSVNFLKGYFEATRQAIFIPKSRAEIVMLLNIYLLEKAIYELSYELNNRPDWLDLPIKGILQLLTNRG